MLHGELVIAPTRRYSVIQHASNAEMVVIRKQTMMVPPSLTVICFHLRITLARESEEEVTQQVLGQLTSYAANQTLADIRIALGDCISHLPDRFHFLRTTKAAGGFATIPWGEEDGVKLEDVVQLPHQRYLLISSAPLLVDREKQVLLARNRELESKLAAIQNEPAQYDFTNTPSSVFKRALIRAQNEGFLARSVNLDELEGEYLKLFSQRDLDEVFGPVTCPLPFKKMCDNPALVRAYVSQLEQVLFRYGIRKTRLDGKYWAHKVLRDMEFVKNPAKFAVWAQGEPWRDDPMELSAYLGSRLLGPGTAEDYTLLHDPIPGEKPAPVVLPSAQAAQPLPQMSFVSIADAAGELHNRAKLTRRTQRVDKPTVSCDNFRIDVLAPQYGICMCGFPRAAHVDKAQAKESE